MYKGYSISLEDMKFLGQMSLLGLDEGVKGIFIRRNDDVIERVIIDFLVYNNFILSRIDEFYRFECFKGGSVFDDMIIISLEFIYKICINCGQLIYFLIDFYFNVFIDLVINVKFICKKCGYGWNYFFGGINFFGIFYLVYRIL